MDTAAPVLILLVSCLVVPAPGRQNPSLPEGRLRFEVASIKRCVSDSGRSGGSQRSSPGRIDLACTSVADLIHIAYDQNAPNRPINSSMSDITQPIKGGPGWIYSERYSVEAAAAGTPNRRTMLGPMLQALLEQRFRVIVHQETEEISMYALTVARGGPKLKRLEDGGCIPRGGAAASTPPAGAQKPRCGTVHYGNSGAGKMLDAVGMTVTGFCAVLRNFLDRPLIDKTGIAGVFNFRVEYAPDEFASGIYSGENNPSGAGLGGLSIFAAIQQQLGLKIEQTKGPHGFLVIDQIERPSEN